MTQTVTTKNDGDKKIDAEDIILPIPVILYYCTQHNEGSLLHRIVPLSEL